MHPSRLSIIDNYIFQQTSESSFSPPISSSISSNPKKTSSEIDSEKRSLLKLLNALFESSSSSDLTLLKNTLLLVDNQTIKRVQSDNGRVCYLVQGSEADPYVVLSTACTCYDFQKRVHSNCRSNLSRSASARTNRSEVFCKHMLAVRVAGVLGYGGKKFERTFVDEKEFGEILKIFGTR
ncbi:hypothetical protein ScalyP_jg11571 [Parmales sp. scaly parma]|nr:hypothetical protein ScalyP_jg11571 [Parmales sp. scaly parma]